MVNSPPPPHTEGDERKHHFQDCTQLPLPVHVLWGRQSRRTAINVCVRESAHSPSLYRKSHQICPDSHQQTGTPASLALSWWVNFPAARCNWGRSRDLNHTQKKMFESKAKMGVFFPACNALTCGSNQDLPSTIQPKGRQVGFSFFSTRPHSLTRIALLCCTVHQRIEHTLMPTFCMCVLSFWHPFCFRWRFLSPPRPPLKIYVVTSLMEFIVVTNSFSDCWVQPFACFSTGCINRCSCETVDWGPAAASGSLLAPHLFALPQSFLVHDVCVSVCVMLSTP